MAAELLDAGPARPVRRRPLVAVVVLVLLVLGVLRLDELLRAREVDALLQRVAAGQSAVAYADRRVASTVTYAMPLLTSASTTAAVRASLQQLVQDAAAGQVDRLAQVQRDVARTRVLPWHADQRRARSAAARLLGAHADHLRAVARDADALYVTQPQLDRGRAAARSALLRAADASAQRRVRSVLPAP